MKHKTEPGHEFCHCLCLHNDPYAIARSCRVDEPFENSIQTNRAALLFRGGNAEMFFHQQPIRRYHFGVKETRSPSFLKDLLYWEQNRKLLTGHSLLVCRSFLST